MNDVVLLEENICNLQKDVADLHKSIRDANEEIKKLTAKLENALALLNLNKNNKIYIKAKAEVVDLKEYQNIKDKIEDVEGEVTDYNTQLSILNKSKESLQSKLNLSSDSLNKSKAKLETYCKVIPFKCLEKT